MPRIPSPINWLKGGSIPNDLLMTLEIPKYYTNLEQDLLHSQVMSPAQVKEFLYDVVNSACDRLELQTVEIPIRDEYGKFVYSDTGLDVAVEDAERLVPTPASVVKIIYFKGLDPESKDDDDNFNLNYYRHPDADLAEVDRNRMLATIDKYLTTPIQFTEIVCYPSNVYKRFSRMRFVPMNPIEDLDEFFGLE